MVIYVLVIINVLNMCRLVFVLDLGFLESRKFRFLSVICFKVRY